MDEVENFVEAFMPAGQGWIQRVITVRLPGDDVGYQFTMWHRDSAEYVRQQYSDETRGAGFVLESSKHKSDVGKPHGCSIWKREERKLRQRLTRKAYLAALQLYSDGTVVNDKQLSLHPVYVTLLNRPHSLKVHCIDAIAYIPKVPLMPKLSADDQR